MNTQMSGKQLRNTVNNQNNPNNQTSEQLFKNAWFIMYAVSTILLIFLIIIIILYFSKNRITVRMNMAN